MRNEGVDHRGHHSCDRQSIARKAAYLGTDTCWNDKHRSIASWSLSLQPALSKIVIHIQVAHIPVSRHIDCNTPNPELTGLPLQELPARFLRSPDG